MTLHAESRWGALRLLLFLGVFLATTASDRRSVSLPAVSSERPQIERVLTVPNVLQKVHFNGRYPRIRYHVLYIALRFSNQTRCAEYETPVLDEIDDLSLQPEGMSRSCSMARTLSYEHPAIVSSRSVSWKPNTISISLESGNG